LVFNGPQSRYVKDGRARELKKCEERVQEFERRISEFAKLVEDKRTELSSLEKEINEGGATQARFRDNQRLRKLRSDLASVLAEYSQHDLEEAARAKRNFEKAYPKMEARLNELKDKVQVQALFTNGLQAHLHPLPVCPHRWRDEHRKSALGIIPEGSCP
jgi:DNA repair exonuclease SbcCD ATPase subunit